jgi:hypothetical protein
MSHIKTLTAAFITTAFAVPAFAQDVEVEPVPEQVETTDTHFSSADLNQDGALSADEFVTYAVMKAEDGDEAMRTLVVSGDYDTKFAAHDADASASLTPDELGDAKVEEVDETPKPMETEEY